MKNILLNLGKFVFGLVTACFGVLQEAFASEENQEEQDSQLMQDADLIGEYNFRTNRLDAGTDPNGWYEEDM